MIRLGIRAGLRVSGTAAIPLTMRTGLISQAGITLGFGSIVAAEFPEWAPTFRRCSWRLIAIHELVGPIVFRQGLARAGEARCDGAEALMVVSNREPYLHNHNGDGHIVASPATGGVAVALDALMRERGGVWIAHGAGSADRAVVDASDRVPVPRRTFVPIAKALDRRAGILAYYGGFSNEGLWPLPHGGRAAAIPQRGLGAYQDVNVRFAAAIDEELAATANRSSSTTTISRSSHRRCARADLTPGRHCSGTSRGRIRIACASVRGGRRF